MNCQSLALVHHDVGGKTTESSCVLSSSDRQDWKQRASVVLKTKRMYCARLICDCCLGTQEGLLSYRNLIRPCHHLARALCLLIKHLMESLRVEFSLTLSDVSVSGQPWSGSQQGVCRKLTQEPSCLAFGGTTRRAFCKTLCVLLG